MAVLILGECFPYRNTSLKDQPFDNTQGRLLATACGLSVEQLLDVVDATYLIQRYLPAYKHRNKKYQQSLRLHWYAKKEQFAKDYALVLLLGKRLLRHVINADEKDFFTIEQHASTSIACIPNPLAEFYWNKDENIERVSIFMKQVLKEYL